MMGVMRWQRRADAALFKPSEDQQLTSVAVSAASEQVEEVLASTDNVEKLTAYAAISVRSHELNNTQRWLWILPQSRLPVEQLQLLDKMVAATGAVWETTGVADNYLDQSALETMINDDGLSAVVVLGEISNWQKLYSSRLFLKNRCVQSIGLEVLGNDDEKKREIWRSFQQLMTND